MKRSGFVVFASVGLLIAHARAADATRPLDYTQRNAPFAPGNSAQPQKQAPVVHESLQQMRVTPPTIEKQPAAVHDRRAPLEVKEQDSKPVWEKNSRSPEKVDQPKSRFDQQRSRFSTSSDQTKPLMVTKYQDSLAAASASNMARFPAVKGATRAKINRFVFRKNGGELADAAQRATVTPAAGGSAPSN